MGVMTCSRGDCTNIMCDRYSSKYGYICGDCFNELIDLGHQTNIQDFMNTNPAEVYHVPKGDWKDFLNDVFESR